MWCCTCLKYLITREGSTGKQGRRKNEDHFGQYLPICCRLKDDVQLRVCFHTRFRRPWLHASWPSLTCRKPLSYSPANNTYSFHLVTKCLSGTSWSTSSPSRSAGKFISSLSSQTISRYHVLLICKSCVQGGTEQEIITCYDLLSKLMCWSFPKIS